MGGRMRPRRRSGEKIFSRNFESIQGGSGAMKQTLGIVGFGRFGRLAATYLKDHFDVVVHDREDCSHVAAALGVRPGSLRDVASCPCVVLCVPISAVRSVLEGIIPDLRQGSLVVDTCSVKEYPIAMMKATLPPHVGILGTHPLFGPDSAASGIQGKKIILCPVRLKSLRKVSDFLESLRLRVLVCSAEDHDLAMASTQAVVQFLGRAFLDMGLPCPTMATPGYERLIKIVDVVKNDTWELFYDLQTHNRFARQVRHKLITSLKTIDRNLRSISPDPYQTKSEGRQK